MEIFVNVDGFRKEYPQIEIRRFKTNGVIRIYTDSLEFTSEVFLGIPSILKADNPDLKFKLVNVLTGRENEWCAEIEIEVIALFFEKKSTEDRSNN